MQAVLVGPLAVGAGCLVPGDALPAKMLLLGIGSGLFHVSAGGLMPVASALPSGLFTAPGVVGLTLGTAVAWSGQGEAAPFLSALAIASTLVVLVRRDFQGPARKPGPEVARSTRFPVFAAITLRSAAWTSLGLEHGGHGSLLIAIGLAAGAGKLLGGLAADFAGWRSLAMVSLAASGALLALGAGPWTLCIAVALLQASTPVGLVTYLGSAPRSPSTSAGLTLGLALAIGGAAALAGLPASVLPVLLAISALAWLVVDTGPVRQGNPV